jgi:lipid-A-disaccharide synthase
MQSRDTHGLPPAWAVGWEFARALCGVALLPWRVAAYLARRSTLRAELAADLASEADCTLEPASDELAERPLTFFVACAEASGEIHACTRVAALRARAAAAGAPPPRFAGLGGVALETAGVELVGRPVERAAMGLGSALGSLPYYLGLVRDAAAWLREHRPDAFVPVDSPALFVPLARIARRYGVPTAHFVTPQYWGWAPWRAKAYGRAVARALAILPFERAWFARRGVAVTHVGHPLLDALPPAPARDEGEGDLLVLLPGSREAVIRRNLPWMADAVAAVRERLGGLEVVVCQESEERAELVRELLGARDDGDAFRLEVGSLHATLARARAALSVSGTVLLDLLHQRVPTVVVYRVSRRTAWMGRWLLTAPWFSSVNLLARSEVFPEFCFAGNGPRAEVGAALVRCAGDGDWREGCLAGLEEAARRLGPPGAVGRAAGAVMALVGEGERGAASRPRAAEATA